MARTSPNHKDTKRNALNTGSLVSSAQIECCGRPPPPFFILLGSYAVIPSTSSSRYLQPHHWTMFRRLLVAGLSAATAQFTHVESKTVEYTFTLVPLRASPALPNVTTRAELNNPALSPDCNLDRLMLLVNDVFPGPTIRADAGDIIKVTLINESPQSVSLHFHGLDMLGQPYSDGTSSVNQCAAGPLETIEYEFSVYNVGTHYWHGHYSLERADGFQGPIVISDPENEDEKQLAAKYYAEEIIFLQDWYHQDGDTRHAGLDSVPFIWIGYAQSFLINGGGIFAPCLTVGEDSIYDSTNPVWKPMACAADCSVIENYIKTITVEPGKTYRLRIIGAQELIGVNFAIQNHNMTVVEADGTIVEPFAVENLDIMPGQRYSVLVTFDKEVGTYLATTGVRYRSQSPTGYILFKYQGAGEGVPSILEDEVNNPFQGTAGFSTAVPPHPVWNDTEPTIALESKLFTMNTDYFPDYSYITQNDDSLVRRIVIAGNQLTQNSTGKLRWAANNVTSMMGAAPMITIAYDAVTTDGALPWPGTKIPGTLIVPDKPPTPYNYTAPVQESVGTFNGETGPSYIPLVEGEVVEIVLQNTLALNGVAEMHTWHLHGHSFWVVGSGVGIFDENTNPDSYNLLNPVRRDTATVLPYGWTALRFQAYNPGAWFFHCAQPAHAAMGMGVIFVISPEKCTPPPHTARSCLETSMFPESESSSSNVIPKIKATALIALAISLLV